MPWVERQPTPKPSHKLFDIQEQPDGKFIAIFPGLLDDQKNIVGTTKKVFETREEAEESVQTSRESMREIWEQKSLEKHYSSFYRVDKTDDGVFVVTFAALQHADGYYVGTSTKKFSFWDEAKQFFLEKLESHEKLAQEPLLELTTEGGQRIIFEDFASFDPKVAPAQEPLSISPELQRHLLKPDKLAGDGFGSQTYQETIQDVGWEKPLFQFITKYLQSEGVDILKELKIKTLDNLTPRQAIELAMQTVLRLTKYSYADVQAGPDGRHPQETESDKKTVLELLQDGLKNKDNPEWKGNGVCRNFASMFKAAFEALKANQGKFNQLQNTYSMYEGDFDTYKPKRKTQKDFLNFASDEGIGHAWNTFVTVTKEGANVVVLDTTWGKVNPETGKAERVDYTLTRMEPVVAEFTKGLDADAPGFQEQINRVLQYYTFKADRPGGVDAVPPKEKTYSEEHYLALADGMVQNYPQVANLPREERLQIGREVQEKITEIDQARDLEFQQKKDAQEKRFFIFKAWEVIKNHNLVDIPPEMFSFLKEEFVNRGENLFVEDIEAIFAFNRRLKVQSMDNYTLPFGPIVRKYLEDKSLSDYHVKDFLFQDDILQKQVFEHIKNRPEFQKFIDTSPRFRVRLREIVPSYFIGFDPYTSKADSAELYAIMSRSRHLERFKFFLSQFDVPKKGNVELFYTKAREQLRALNPDIYDTNIMGKGDYDIIKEYDTWRAQLVAAIKK